MRFKREYHLQPTLTLTLMLTVPVLKKFPTDAKVTALSSGLHLSYGQTNGGLVIGDAKFEISSITSMFEFPNGELIVGTTDSLHTYRNSEEIKRTEFETGVEKIIGMGNFAVVIDGLGRAAILNSDGEFNDLNESSVLFASLGNNIAIATEAGQVSIYSQQGQKQWERPPRGEVGERITSIGWNGENLVVAREGHGLVPGEEEALEIEYWLSGNLEKRLDIGRRVIAIAGRWMGLDMGGVMFDEEIVAKLDHPVNRIIDFGDYCLAASWFHLHRIEKDGIIWSVETQGMVEYLSSNPSGTSVLIAGSDQNDYTESEPVILVDSTSKPVPVIEEATAIDDWGDAPVIDIDASELYGNDQSIEDLAGISISNKSDQTGLIDALTDEIEIQVQEDEEEDLMLALSLDADEVIAPTANAGGDQTAISGDDDAAIITLDGSGTLDPQDRVVSWSWVDESGKEISNSKIVKVKLPVGLHRLELRIKDKDDRWSSDSISVRID